MDCLFSVDLFLSFLPSLSVSECGLSLFCLSLSVFSPLCQCVRIWTVSFLSVSFCLSSPLSVCQNMGCLFSVCLFLSFLPSLSVTEYGLSLSCLSLFVFPPLSQCVRIWAISFLSISFCLSSPLSVCQNMDCLFSVYLFLSFLPSPRQCVRISAISFLSISFCLSSPLSVCQNMDCLFSICLFLSFLPSLSVSEYGLSLFCLSLSVFPPLSKCDRIWTVSFLSISFCLSSPLSVCQNMDCLFSVYLFLSFLPSLSVSEYGLSLLYLSISVFLSQNWSDWCHSFSVWKLKFTYEIEPPHDKTKYSRQWAKLTYPRP